VRAVIFDLWDTLAFWDREAAAGSYARMADRVGADLEQFEETWNEGRLERELGPLPENVRAVLTKLRLDLAHADDICELRRQATRAALVPREGAIATLEELAQRGLKRGLISMCSGDVADVWEETEFAPHLDDTVFSCAVGLRKPEPPIYELACERLGVEPQDCLFVGDGANDELAGAERVGMRAACILRPGAEESLWPEARDWEPTIRSLPEVLELV
jgi:putative hydrolase of the HAD superfamily